MRTLAKESINRPVRAIAPLPQPTPAQHLGYKKAHLSQLIRQAGLLTASASLKILKMNLEDVERETEVYSKLINQTSKAA